ncbi:MAG: hypothetical protein MJA82_06355 [Clostridia bacterium]|nr:hypothetical protein [Clostridia bacterium]
MKTYVDFPKYLKHMSGDEVAMYLPKKYTNALLMRSIILNEKKYYRPTRDSRTLRSVWYSIVKPTLDKLGLLTSQDNTEAGLTKWDATLSRYMADLLRDGLILYKDLGIIDTSRRKETPSIHYSVADTDIYGFQTTIDTHAHIIIATEKDTVYDIINQIATLLGCSSISCKGQNSLGAMEYLIKDMYERGYFDKFDTLYILTMTDYDPAGYYIADALKKQAEDILYALKIFYVNVEYKRIGIEPDQLDYETIEQNKYTPKPVNLEKWLDLTGGINGEAKGLELDALQPDEIRDIFVENIREYIDPDIFDSIIKESYLKRKIMDAIKFKVHDIVNNIYENCKYDVELDDYDIFEFAKEGYYYLPANKICSGIGHEEILREAVQYFDI